MSPGSLMICASEQPSAARGVYYLNKQKFLTSPRKPWKLIIDQLAVEGSQVQQDFRNRFPWFYENGNSPFYKEEPMQVIIQPPPLPQNPEPNKYIEQGLLFDHAGMRNEPWDDNEL